MISNIKNPRGFGKTNIERKKDEAFAKLTLSYLSFKKAQYKKSLNELLESLSLDPELSYANIVYGEFA